MQAFVEYYYSNPPSLNLGGGGVELDWVVCYRVAVFRLIASPNVIFILSRQGGGENFYRNKHNTNCINAIIRNALRAILALDTPRRVRTL